MWNTCRALSPLLLSVLSAFQPAHLQSSILNLHTGGGVCAGLVMEDVIGGHVWREGQGGEGGQLGEAYCCFRDTGAPRVPLVDVECIYGVVDTYSTAVAVALPHRG